MKKVQDLRIGIDTGGTFTDFLAVSGAQRLAFKIPSTPRAPAEAILQGIRRILIEFGGASGRRQPVEIAHGTTVATNAMLERKGARTALITTEGFADVIEIGRQARPDLYNLGVERPAPLVPRELRFGLRERTGPAGEAIIPLDPRSLSRIKRELQRAGVEAIALSLLFSFANPAHERAVIEALADLGVPISASHLILPEYREYERTSTVVINAYLAPRVGRYLQELQRGLTGISSISSPPRLRIMQSSGGSISAEVAAREPVRTILSGPAGGVVAALHVGGLAGIVDLLTFDMGGTSTDVALCRGTARTTNEAQLTGLPVAVPTLDIHTVGAGGGSIASVDAGGALRVGPESAGADPGPACYGRGTRATVTDANLVLGRFAGAGLLAGEMKLDRSRAEDALDALASEMSRVSGQRLSRPKAALGVIRVANANMEKALRLVSIERGHDPRLFTLVSFGGAGGLHAAALAEALRIPEVLIPAYPGNFSALGVLLADVVKDYSRTVMLAVPAGERAPETISGHFRELAQRARVDLRAEGFAASRLKLWQMVAMRYRGQSFELDVAWGRDAIGDFHAAHRARYGHADSAREVEIVSVKLRAVGLTSKPQLVREPERARRTPRPEMETQVWLGRGKTTVPVYERTGLEPGTSFVGPAIILEYGSTTLIPPKWRARVDGWQNLLLRSST
jgi:N-methylhydantoinase A